jgi:hypothetical protein
VASEGQVSGWSLLQKLREWLLLLLRFAITHEPSDRSTVLSIAYELDAARRRSGPSTLRFFVRTSGEVCDAILRPGEERAAAVLGTHIARIDDRRLKAAFAAAVNLQQAVGCLHETTETAQASATAVKALD